MKKRPQIEANRLRVFTVFFLVFLAIVRFLLPFFLVPRPKTQGRNWARQRRAVCGSSTYAVTPSWTSRWEGSRIG
jgi:hypothetical protein